MMRNTPFAGEHDSPRPACELRRRRRQNLVLPKELAAKAATNEGRREAHLLLLQSEYLGNCPGFVHHRLRGIMDSELVAFPSQGASVQLDRSVMMPWSRVLDIH